MARRSLDPGKSPVTDEWHFTPSGNSGYGLVMIQRWRVAAPDAGYDRASMEAFVTPDLRDCHRHLLDLKHHALVAKVCSWSAVGVSVSVIICHLVH